VIVVGRKLDFLPTTAKICVDKVKEQI